MNKINYYNLKNKNKEGIALITLILTVIIAIILSSVGIGIIVNKNYFGKSEEMQFMSNIENYRQELADYIENEEFTSGGKYNENELYANKSLIYYQNEKKDGNIKTILPTILDEDMEFIEIYKGKIIYTGEDKKFREKVNSDVTLKDDSSLVARFVSSMNDGISFTKNASTWKNLIKNSTISEISNMTGEFDADTKTYKMDNSSLKLTLASSISNSYTVEIISKNDNYTLTLGNAVDTINFRKNLNDKKINRNVYVMNNGRVDIYYDGMLQSTSQKSDSSLNQILISGSGNIIEIRLYDRALKLSEIMQNDMFSLVKYE